jgi:hypothetical protein
VCEKLAALMCCWRKFACTEDYVITNRVRVRMHCARGIGSLCIRMHTHSPKSWPKRGSMNARVAGSSGCPGERNTSCTTGGTVAISPDAMFPGWFGGRFQTCLN